MLPPRAALAASYGYACAIRTMAVEWQSDLPTLEKHLSISFYDVLYLYVRAVLIKKSSPVFFPSNHIGRNVAV
jgi:hypothetical protein